MIEQFVNQFGFVAGTGLAIVFTVLYIARSRTDTSSYVQKNESKTENTYAEALLALARIGETSNQIAREMVASTREATAEMRGMVAMLDSNTKATRDTAMGMDELNGMMPGIRDNVQAIHSGITSLETNVGLSMKDQLQPVVKVLIGIDTQLTKLASEEQSNHSRTNNSLVELIAMLLEARDQIMKAVEPIVMRHIVDFMPTETPATTEITNGNHTDLKSQETP